MSDRVSGYEIVATVDEVVHNNAWVFNTRLPSVELRQVWCQEEIQEGE